MPDENGKAQRVSISTETLRTEIRLANAELEIRMMKELNQALSNLADKAALENTQGKIKELRDDVDALGQDKAGRDAVQNARRFFIGGGILTTLLMFCQLALTFYIVTQQTGS